MNIYDEAIEKLIIQKDFDLILKALERAKKVEKLLELYKSVHGVVQSWDTMPDVQNKINKLEKELEELK